MGMAAKRSTTKTAVANADAGPYVTRAEFLDTRDMLLASHANLKASLEGDLRAIGVVVERIDANVRGLAEALVSTREELITNINDVERRLSERISMLEIVVREHSEQLRQQSALLREHSALLREHSELLREHSEQLHQQSEEIRSLRVAVEGLRHDFDHRSEKAELAALERRVSALEARVSSRK